VRKVLRQNIVRSTAEDFVHENIPAEDFVQVIEKAEVGFTQRKMENELFTKQAIIEEGHAKGHSQEGKMTFLDWLFISDFENKFMNIPIDGNQFDF
jgi:hypothetical protein